MEYIYDINVNVSTCQPWNVRTVITNWNSYWHWLIFKSIQVMHAAIYSEEKQNCTSSRAFYVFLPKNMLAQMIKLSTLGQTIYEVTNHRKTKQNRFTFPNPCPLSCAHTHMDTHKHENHPKFQGISHASQNKPCTHV